MQRYKNNNKSTVLRVEEFSDECSLNEFLKEHLESSDDVIDIKAIRDSKDEIDYIIIFETGRDSWAEE